MDMTQSAVPPADDRLDARHEYLPGYVDHFGSRSDNRTILIVEDDESIAELLGDLLSGEGYRVVVVHDGRAGLAYARREHPAMVLSDCMLPGVSGTEMAAALRKQSATRHIPIALMSSTRPKGLNLPGVPFLAKPFEIDDVLNLVAHCMREQPYAQLYGEA